VNRKDTEKDTEKDTKKDTEQPKSISIVVSISWWYISNAYSTVNRTQRQKGDTPSKRGSSQPNYLDQTQSSEEPYKIPTQKKILQARRPEKSFFGQHLSREK